MVRGSRGAGVGVPAVPRMAYVSFSQETDSLASPTEDCLCAAGTLWYAAAVALASLSKMYRAKEDGRPLPVLLLGVMAASGEILSTCSPNRRPVSEVRVLCAEWPLHVSAHGTASRALDNHSEETPFMLAKQ